MVPLGRLSLVPPDRGSVGPTMPGLGPASLDSVGPAMPDPKGLVPVMPYLLPGLGSVSLALVGPVRLGLGPGRLVAPALGLVGPARRGRGEAGRRQLRGIQRWSSASPAAPS